jgi:hypothetical protein
MNCSLIVVKNPDKREYYSIRVHWDYGNSLENWLNNNYNDYRRLMMILIPEGHRSSINESYKSLKDQPGYSWITKEDYKFWTHKTKKDAMSFCEYKTIAYFNGKWNFSHNP